MRAKRILSTLLLAIAMLAVYVAPAGASGEPKYRVVPVYPPPLERPLLDLDPKLLGPGVTGVLPTNDGAPFHLNLPAGDERPASEDDARMELEKLLRVLRSERSPMEFRLARTVTLPPADKGFIDQAMEEGRSQTRKRLEGELGPLSSGTLKAIDEIADEVRQMALRTQEIFLFHQMYERFPLETAGIQVRWIEGQGFVAISGQVFSKVNLENEFGLDADEAVNLGMEYVARSTKVLREPRPEPEPVILPYGRAMRFVWRLDVTAVEGAYRLWLDAEKGEVLRLEPLFWADDGQGLVFDPDPDAGTRRLGFQVDSPSGNQYRLLLTGELDVNNAGADGVTSGDLTIADAGTGLADFDVSPINGTVVERTNQTNYNSRFQEVNAYGWVYSAVELFEAMGGPSFPSLTVTVNHNNPCGFGIDNACANTSANSLTFGIGSATSSNSTSQGALFNSALDSTVVLHELGHILTHRQVPGGNAGLTGAMREGLSDFWAGTYHDTATYGGWQAHNSAVAVQTSWMPREAEALDVFPEHRAFNIPGNLNFHGDGQILYWALWSARTGLNNLSVWGTLSIDMNLLDALATASVPATGTTDKAIHDSYLEILQELATEYQGYRSIHKVLAGFARAGILLSARDAVIDIDDDYMARSSTTGPTFTVWPGRDYQFTGSTAVTANAFNTRYEIELANDASFTTNLVTSGVQAGVAVSAQGVPMATWTLPAADWQTLRASDYIYYRVTTTDGTGGNQRQSSAPGNGFLTGVSAARAVVNESGEQVCCGVTASAGAGPWGAWAVLVPMAVAAVWRQRLKHEG